MFNSSSHMKRFKKKVEFSVIYVKKDQFLTFFNDDSILWVTFNKRSTILWKTKNIQFIESLKKKRVQFFESWKRRFYSLSDNSIRFNSLSQLEKKVHFFEWHWKELIKFFESCRKKVQFLESCKIGPIRWIIWKGSKGLNSWRKPYL